MSAAQLLPMHINSQENILLKKDTGGKMLAKLADLGLCVVSPYLLDTAAAARVPPVASRSWVRCHYCLRAVPI